MWGAPIHVTCGVPFADVFDSLLTVAPVDLERGP